MTIGRVVRATGEGAIAGYATAAGVTAGVGALHGAARGAAGLARRGAMAGAVAGDLPGPRTASFYANRYGYSGPGAMEGTTTQQSLLQQQRAIQTGIAHSVETPRIGAYHNEDPRALAPLSTGPPCHLGRRASPHGQPRRGPAGRGPSSAPGTSKSRGPCQGRGCCKSGPQSCSESCTQGCARQGGRQGSSSLGPWCPQAGPWTTETAHGQPLHLVDGTNLNREGKDGLRSGRHAVCVQQR